MEKNAIDTLAASDPISKKNNVKENNILPNIPIEVHEKISEKHQLNGKFAVPCSLVDFALSVFDGARISQEWQKEFDNFHAKESDEDRNKIVIAAKEKDPEFKITLSLAIAVLEGSSHSKSHEIMLSYIENIVSTIEKNDKNSADTLFKSWLYSSKGVSNTISVFYDRISKIKDLANKPISKVKRKNLLLIASIWLYRKNEIEFPELIAFLSKEIYDNKGQSSGLIEPGAVAYTVASSNSNKKSGFGKVLFKLVEAEQLAKNELRQKILACDTLEKKLEISKINNTEMLIENERLEDLVKEKETQLDIIASELENVKESARHEKIHTADDKQDLRMKLIRSLEGELKSAIEKAVTANSRIEPNPKNEIVAYQLAEAAEIISRELTWLKS